MDVFDAFLNGEPSLAYLRKDVPQFLKQGLQLLVLQQPDTLEHRDVSHRAEHVRLCQIHVHLTVATNGEAFNLRRHLISFVPKLHSLKIRN